jgi:hypothetical protein
MNPDRAIGLILALSLAVVLTLGIWLLRRGAGDSEPPPVTPSVTPTASPALLPTATPASAAAVAPGYRLAGTVVGDLSYAIIEDPNGANHLYRPGQVIPGLGEVTVIDADRIVVAGSGGDIILQIAPAPTATPSLRRTEPIELPIPPEATPAARRRRDRSESESSP